MMLSDKALNIGFYIIVTAAAILIICTSATILIQTIFEYEISWDKIAWLIAGTGILITPAFGFKILAKKYEVKQLAKHDKK